MISDPLHRLDCCVITDGGGAMVVVRRRSRGPETAEGKLIGAGESIDTRRAARSI